MLAETIVQAIKEALPGSDVRLDSGDGVHFHAVVISEHFEGLSLVRQQQLVNAALKDFFQSGALHALSLKTYTPSVGPNATARRGITNGQINY